MNRRELIAGLGGAAAWPLVARAQRPTLPVVGFVNLASAKGGYAQNSAAFFKGLSEAGYVDSRDVIIELHWAEGRADRLPAMTEGIHHVPVLAHIAINVGLVLDHRHQALLGILFLDQIFALAAAHFARQKNFQPRIER